MESRYFVRSTTNPSMDFTADTEVSVEVAIHENRKQVGLLGGNFNPVHYAHLILADQVYHQLGLDQVLMLPSFEPPHVDTKSTIDGKDRLKMLELAIEDNPLLEIERCEIEREGKSYTFDTLKELKRQNPTTDYYFIIGGDMVEYLPKWYRIEELSQMVQFVGVRRPGYPSDSPYPILWVDVPLIDISSTLIRNKIRAGCSTRYFLPDAVLDYIKQKGLYQEND